MATNRIIVLSNEYEQQHFEELQKIVVNLTNCCRNEVNKDIENQWTRLVAVANEYFQLPTTEHDNNEIARVIVDIIYICAAYSDVDKPWCSPAISDKVDALLSILTRTSVTDESSQLDTVTLNDLLLDHTSALANTKLQQYFKRSTLSSNSWNELDEPQWKSTAPECVTVIEWLLTRLCSMDVASSNRDRDRLDTNLRRILPFILTIVEDSDIETARHGLSMLTRLMRATSRNLILRTGLVDVLYESIQRKTVYRGHEADELALMADAINAIIEWASLYRNDDNVHNGEASIIDDRLEAVMRKGPLMAIHFHGERASVASVVFASTKLLIERLGLLSVKFLKALVLFTCDWIKASPVGVGNSALDVQLSAVEFAHTLILTCQPRMSCYHGQLLTAMATQWRALYKMEQGASNVLADKEPLRSGLCRTVELLHQSCLDDPHAMADRAAILALDDSPETCCDFRILLSNTEC